MPAAGVRHRSAILTYHSIDSSGSVISVTPEQFRIHMRLLADAGTRVVPLCEVWRTPGAVAITFDDGFINFHEHALPILAEYGFPATVFVVTGHTGALNNWASQPAGAVPAMPLMSFRELREAGRYGVSLGAHTVTHPRLTALPEQKIAAEMAGSRDRLQDETGLAVRAFAYPYGAVNRQVREMAAQHFEFACGTGLDFIGADCDVLNLTRLDVYYLRRAALFGLLGTAGAELYIGARRALRHFRRH